MQLLGQLGPRRPDDAESTVIAVPDINVGTQVDGGREHPTVVVVGVLPVQLHPAGRVDDQVWSSAERSLELHGEFVVGHDSSAIWRSLSAAFWRDVTLRLTEQLVADHELPHCG
jgi:hypothetical protein